MGVGAAADVGGRVKDKILVVGGRIAIVVDDGDAGKERGAKRVNGGIGHGCPREAVDVGAKLLRSEGLVDRAIHFFANETEDFDNTEVRFEDLGIGDGSDLAAGVEMLREARGA